MSNRDLELAAIEMATSYAVANGYGADDKVAVGLVLVGMAIAAACDPETCRMIAADYRNDFRRSAAQRDAWVGALDNAARR